MCTKNYNTTFWDLINFIHKNCTLVLKIFNNRSIMYNLMSNIYWCSMFVNSTLNYLNSTLNSSAKTSWISQKYLHS